MAPPQTVAGNAAIAAETRATVLAVLIDPTRESVVVSWVDLPTLPADPPRWGVQLAPDTVVELVGKTVWQHRLPADEALIVGDGEGVGWSIAGLGVFRGRGLVMKYDRIVDAYADTQFETLD
jgi:hypothetical protein